MTNAIFFMLFTCLALLAFALCLLTGSILVSEIRMYREQKKRDEVKEIERSYE